MNPGIPNSVRKAMAKQAAAGPHPESDLLNAYAERALSPAEDSQVAGHLATCAECRHVLFLAQSAAENIAQPPQMLAERRPVTWWRWAMPVTAALAIAVAVVTMNKTDVSPAHRQVAQLVREDKSDSQTSASPKPEQSKARPATPAKRAKDFGAAAAHASEKKQSEPLHGVNAPASPPPAATASTAPAPVYATTNTINAQQENVQSQSAAKQYGPSQRLAPNQTASTAVDVVADARTAETMSADNKAAAPSPFVFKSGGASAMADSETTAKRSALSRMASQVWRISSDGHLERMMQNQWHRALNGVQKSFRVVAYVQDHVWAGGSGPDLFHSADGGDNWDTIKVKTADSEFNGNMQTIRASDAQHLAIVADDGSTWTTADGGQTWAKQQ